MRADEVIRRLRMADPARGLAPLPANERDELRRFITANRPAGPRPLAAPSLRQRRWLLLATGALAAVIAAGAGAWALRDRAADTTSLACAFEPDSMSIIASASGDPLADCRDEWRRLHDTTPPALAAYDSGGHVTVVRAGSAVPKEWQLLPAGFRQDARLIELDERLGDTAAGLESGCFSLDRARPLAEGLLRRVGLAEWSVVTEPGAAESTGTCATYSLDRASRQIVLLPRQGHLGGNDAPYLQLSRRLAAAAAADCLTVLEATGRVRREAARFGWTEAHGSLVINSLGGTGCADIVVNVGGRVEVTIRGTGAGK